VAGEGEMGERAVACPSNSAQGPTPVLSVGAGGVEGLGTNEAEEAVEAPSGDAFAVRPSKYRDMQVGRVGKRKLFDRKRRKVFLEWFAATGNCVFAAAKAGVVAQTVWKHRMKDADFAEAFDRALDQGVVRAKARIIEDKPRAPIEIDGDLDADALVAPDPQAVLNMIGRQEAAKAGVPARRQRTTARIASNAEVEKALAKRIAVFVRRERAMVGSSVQGPAAAGDLGSGEDSPGCAATTPPPSRAWSCSGADCPQQSAAHPGDGRPEHSPSGDGEA
jgi:hypothetical protein